MKTHDQEAREDADQDREQKKALRLGNLGRASGIGSTEGRFTASGPRPPHALQDLIDGGCFARGGVTLRGRLPDP